MARRVRQRHPEHFRLVKNEDLNTRFEATLRPLCGWLGVSFWQPWTAQDYAPTSLGGENVAQVTTNDGVKYILADDSWLLIRPSGTEPVLRVYAEGRTPEMVKALMAYGNQVAASVS